eukprot:TRINITY_DN16083_c0_g1_i1.p1 TRINITY_DN16083_c0_g1~~TRINITY_DN16083_c0_g1_i1.p1  ORF type:complete len:146 (+),score=11.31 TRINITY_DN16083_c0_g1_i1:89-526(+)
MIRRPPRSTQSRSSAASDVYKRQRTAYNNGRRDFYRPGSRVYDKNGRVSVNKNYNPNRTNTMITSTGRNNTSVRTNNTRNTVTRNSNTAATNVRNSANTRNNTTTSVKNTRSENVVRTNTRSNTCLLYTSPSPRDRTRSRMPSSA